MKTANFNMRRAGVWRWW